MDPQITPPAQPSGAPSGGTPSPTPQPSGSHNTNSESAANKSKKLMMVLVAILALVLVVAVVYAATHKKKTTTTVTQQTNAALEPEEGLLQTEGELSQFKQEAEITVTASGFTPQTLTMPKDTKVIWHNTDSKIHTVAITPGTTVPDKFANNKKIEVGGGFPFVIHQTGTFHYYDVDNPTMTGEFTIQ